MFQAFTMPEYLRKRFGGKRIRMYSSFFALIGYVLFNITVSWCSRFIHCHVRLNNGYFSKSKGKWIEIHVYWSR